MLFIIFLTFFSFYSFTNNRFGLIELLNMRNMTWDEEAEWPNEPYPKYIRRVFQYQSIPSRIKIRHLSFKLATTDNEYMPVPNISILDKQALTDLKIIHNKDSINAEEIYLGNILNRTFTSIGYIHFLNMLAFPDNSHEKIIQKQKIIQYLINKEDSCNEIKNHLHEIMKNEGIFLSFYENMDPFKNMTEKLYFSSNIPTISRYLNQSEKWLMLKQISHHYENLFAIGISAVSTAVRGLLSLLTIHAIFSRLKMEETLIPSLYNYADTSKKVDFLIASYIKNPAYYFALSIIYKSLCVSRFAKTKDQYEGMESQIKLIKYVQKKIIFFNQFIKSAEAISHVVDKHQELKKLPCSKTIISFFKDQKSEALQNLLNKLNTNTFSKKNSFFSHQGRILYVYQQLHQLKQDFVSLYNAIGELDAYVSIVTLFNEHKDKKLPFTFPQFNTQKGNPTIILQNFWNPFVDTEKVVVNSIAIGSNTTQKNVIITGPNTGGKTTVMKSIALTSIIAQALGICPAEYAELSIFDKIETYLTITDDLSAGKSLFKQQADRVADILKILSSTPVDKNILLIFDELFNGTNPHDAELAACSVAEYIANYNNCLSFFSTHFKGMSLLENQNKAFVNYKVSVKIHDDATVIPTYKIEKGISQQNIALNVLHSTSIPEIIIKNIKNKQLAPQIAAESHVKKLQKNNNFGIAL